MVASERAVDGLERKLRAARADTDAAISKARSTEDKTRAATEDLSRRLSQAESQVRRLQGVADQAKHKYAAAEKEMERLRDRLRAEMARGEARDKRAQSEAEDASPVAQERRKVAEEEIVFLRGEVRTLNGQLAEALNLANLRVAERTAAGRDGCQEHQEELMAAVRADADQRVARLRSQLNAAEEEREAATRANQGLTAALEEAEAVAAPLRARVRKLEKDLSEAAGDVVTIQQVLDEERAAWARGRAGNRAGDPGSSSEYDDTDGGGGGGGGGGGDLGPFSPVRHDKEYFRLQLQRVDALTPAAARTCVKKVCLELGVADPADILPALERISHVLTAVPGMEAFIEDALSIADTALSGEGRAGSSGPAGDPQAALTTLRRAVAEAAAVRDTQILRLGLVEELGRRPKASRSLAAALSDRQIIHTVRNLVSIERRGGDEAGDANENEPRDNRFDATDRRTGPTIGLKAEVGAQARSALEDVMVLLDTDDAEAVGPLVSDLFLRARALESFAAKVCVLLNLGAEAAPSAAVARLRSLLEEMESFNPATAGGSGVDLDRVRQQMDVLVQLRRQLGAETDAEVLAAVESLAARARGRAGRGGGGGGGGGAGGGGSDEMAPALAALRAQHDFLVGGLTERLGVTSVREILPAVDAMISLQRT